MPGATVDVVPVFFSTKLVNVSLDPEGSKIDCPYSGCGNVFNVREMLKIDS